MPTPINKPVSCPQCNRNQPDQGRGSTCIHCGCSPLPSWRYPVGHWLHPSTDFKPPMPQPKPYRRRTPVPKLPL